MESVPARAPRGPPLTGESSAVDKKTDDGVYAGSAVRDGEATAVITATGARTYFGRTTQLVEGARPKLHVEEVISRIVMWLLAKTFTYVPPVIP